MTISGGIKFFDKSKCLLKDGAAVAASSGDASADYALSMNRYLRWDSVGSNDSTAETLVVTFPSATIDRILLVDHNLKDFSITYGAGASAFSGVVGIDGAGSGIVETAFTQDTAYYEFTPVTTTRINITATKTQIANAQKYITLIAATEEIGTLEGYPVITPTISSNEKRAQTIGGKYITQKSYEVFGAKLALEHTSQDDINILNTIYEAQDPFLIWPCGGKYGTTNFSVDFKSWRLKDLYQVQTFGQISNTFRKSIYTSSPITTITVGEEV